MQYTLDSEKEHIMRSWISGKNGYLTLGWPRDLSLRELDFCVDLVLMQLNKFRNIARRKENGDIEYESWLPPPRYDEPERFAP